MYLLLWKDFHDTNVTNFNPENLFEISIVYSQFDGNFEQNRSGDEIIDLGQHK